LRELTASGCTNCGSTTLVKFAPARFRCAYCGTTRAQEERVLERIRCSRCGVDNERFASYCKMCGAALTTRWRPVSSGRIDPAVVSILCTVLGLLFVPVAGGVLGVVLGHRALRQAQAGGGSEELARIAIAAGWIGIVLSLVPVCLGLGTWGVGTCASLFDALVEVR
jgi:hypothetical protein